MYKSSVFGETLTFFRDKPEPCYCNDIHDILEKYGFGEFDPGGISSYLTFRYPIGRLTMFTDIKKVPCGRERGEDGEENTYWYPKFNTMDISFSNALSVIENLLFESIRYCTSGKKKLSIMVSGGVDSSLLVALVRELFPDGEIYTYSAGFYGEDEFEYARLVADKFRTIHQERVLTIDDYVGDNSYLPRLIRQKAEPLHPNEIALAAVEEMAKADGCDVALCGEGGDDIFGGYGQNLRMYLNYDGRSPFLKFFLDNYRYFSIEDRKGIIKGKYLLDDVELLYEAVNINEFPEDIKNLAFYFTQKVHTVGLITRGINAARFNNLDVEFPYLHTDLVNFVNALPFDYKLHWKSKQDEDKAQGKYFREVSERHDVPKYILKKLAEKYLPEEVIYRPKYGFPVPFDLWFRNINKWPLDAEIFKTEDMSELSGWKKFMLINLDTFVKEFKMYKGGNKS